MKTWLFHADPESYDLQKKIIKGCVEDWRPWVYVDEMEKGDRVVLCSDGLERGDPEMLRLQMARLHRLAYRVVWVNPLKASPGYAPLAAGMAAALPHVDDFVEGHSLASLEALAEVVAR